MMYTCISLIVHPPFEIPGSAPAQATPRHYTSGAKVCVRMCVALSVKLCALFTLGDAS